MILGATLGFFALCTPLTAVAKTRLPLPILVMLDANFSNVAA